ncbi:MAG: M20/M25/M40 family metallo-hydrolase [Clostridiales bacterium]|nr:M20/M25/M40 family metallo-hydrolase [Clostridiales bacterium]
MYIGISVGAIILIFLAIILIRTACFKPKKLTGVDKTPISFDGDNAVECLRSLIKCKTISYKDKSLENNEEFDKLLKLLPTLYPDIYKLLEVKTFNGRGILLKWKGKSSDTASVMMSHFDVVPVNEDLWEEPPFEGVIKDGVLWGRGAVDTKITLNGAMFGANYLAKNGFIPNNDVYFAFSGEEEINGPFAKEVVDYFEENKINLTLVLDEGGAVVNNVFPGVKQPCGLVGIAEKGMVDVLYSTKSNGGHASAPKPHTPVGVLSKACVNVENKPFKMRLTKPVKEMFNSLGRYSTFVYRLIFANLWCFGWVLDLISKKSGGEINAMLRTTVAFTQMKGSSASNVIPPESSMVSNIRINPSETVDSVIKTLERNVDDKNVKISVIHGTNPSRVSIVDCDGYKKVEKAITSTFEGSIVSPYLMVQCSDSRHYGKISDRVYRFSASDFTSEERACVHGNNERIRVNVVKRAVEFYIRLLKDC